MPPPAPVPTPESDRKDWRVVFAAFLCIVFIFGVPTMVMPVIYSPIIDEFGWTRTQVTLVATIKFGAGAVVGIFFGALADRFSIRKLVLAAGVLSGVSMIGFLAVDSLAEFYVMGLLMGLGAISVMVAMKVLVSKRFFARQGVAIGATMLGTSVAGTFTPVLTSVLIDLYGWRMAVALESVGIWLVALPAFLWMVTESESGPARVRTPAAFVAQAASPPAADPAAGLAFSEILRTRTFWYVGLAVWLIGFVDQSMGQHLVLYLDRDVGLGRSVAAGVLSAVFFISIAGKLGFGWIYDRLSIKGIMACYYLMAVSVLLLFSAQMVVMLVLFSLTRGLAHGGAIVDIPVMAKHCFGPRALGKTIGVLTACVTLGFAAGPPIVGYLYDSQGSYRTAFFLLAGLSVASGLTLLGVTPTYRDRMLLTTAGSEQPTEPAPARGSLAGVS
jgi:MFS family permease